MRQKPEKVLQYFYSNFLLKFLIYTFYQDNVFQMINKNILILSCFLSLICWLLDLFYCNTIVGVVTQCPKDRHIHICILVWLYYVYVQLTKILLVHLYANNFRYTIKLFIFQYCDSNIGLYYIVRRIFIALPILQCESCHI